jgi:hypothetical protein
MSQTFADIGKYDIVAKGTPNPARVIRRRTNGADIKPNMIVTEEGESYPDVDLIATSGETPLGVAWRHANPVDIPASWDIDDAFADNTWIEILLPHDGELEIYGDLAISDSTTSTEQDVAAGDTLVVSATTAGQLDRSAEDGSGNVNLVMGNVARDTSSKYAVSPTGAATKKVRYRY